VIGPSSLLAVSAVAVALALQISDGRYDPWALSLVAAATAIALVAAIWRRRGGVPTESAVLAQAWLAAGSVAGLGFWLFGIPVPDADPRAFQGGFRWFVLITLVVLSAYLCIHLRASLIRARFLLLLLFFAVMGLVTIRAAGGRANLYVALALIIAGAWLLARAMPGNFGELAAALMLFQPRALVALAHDVVSGPPVLFCFALALYAIARRAHWALAGGALALLAASSPYAALLAVPLALSMPRRGVAWVAMSVVVGLVSPFGAAGGPIALDTVGAAPLSFAPLVGVDRDDWQRYLIAIVVALVVLVISLPRRPGLRLACAAAAAAWSAALLFRPDAFAKGWWVSTAVLAAAAAAAPAPYRQSRIDADASSRSTGVARAG
jgi:hypothetical protein